MSIASGPIGGGALAASSSLNYSLQVTSGTFTLSMQGAGKLITDIYPTGTFTLDGKAVGLTAQRPANFDAGSFTLTGNDVGLDYGFGIIANNGSFTLSGQDVVLESGFGIVVDSGSFSLSGTAIDFTKQMNISAELGTFTYTGQDALKGVSEAFDVGAFTLTGRDFTLFAGRFLRPQTATFTYSSSEIKFRGWFSPTVPDAIWTEVA